MKAAFTGIALLATLLANTDARGGEDRRQKVNEFIAKRLQAFATCFLVSLSFLLLHGTTQAATFCVRTATDLTSALLNARNNGEDDIIQLVQGTYQGGFFFFPTEAFNLTTEGGYTSGCASRVVDPTNTVLDGTGTTRVFSLSSSQSSDLTVDGLTLQNGAAIAGGGLLAITEGDLTLTNNIFSSNSARGVTNGGGVYVSGASKVTLTNNTLNSNSTDGGFGGGVFVTDVTTVILANNTLSNNTTHASGGGVYVSFTPTVTLTNNIFYSNSTRLGGGGGVFINGFRVSALKVTLTNNTISTNSAGVSIFLTGVRGANIYNNIIWNNTGGDLKIITSFPSTINLFNNDFQFTSAVPFPIDPSVRRQRKWEF